MKLKSAIALFVVLSFASFTVPTALADLHPQCSPSCDSGDLPGWLLNQIQALAYFYNISFCFAAWLLGYNINGC